MAANSVRTRWLAQVKVLAGCLLDLELSLGVLRERGEIWSYSLRLAAQEDLAYWTPSVTAAASKRVPAAGDPFTTARAAKPIKHSAIPGAFCGPGDRHVLSEKRMGALEIGRMQAGCPRLCNGIADRAWRRSRSSSHSCS